MTHRSPWYYWPFRWLALTGADGEPSFSKLIIVGVLASYLPGAVPFGVACLVIAAAYGRGMLRDFLTRGSITVREAASSVAGRVANVVHEAVEHTVGNKPAPEPKDELKDELKDGPQDDLP